MEVRCVIIDDELLAIKVLENYLSRMPSFVVVATFSNATDALDYIRTEKPDLLFLDIMMPRITGLDFLRALNNGPKAIFTTAYTEYALQAYELNALDYLVKPISFERFMKALDKYYNTSEKNIKSNDHPAIYVKEHKRLVKVYINDILYIESVKDYVTIHTDKKSIITRQQISYFESSLASAGILRIHRSFLISKDKIDAFSSTSVEIAGKELPIGRSYKVPVLQELDSENQL